MSKASSFLILLLSLFWGCTTSAPESAPNQPDYAQLELPERPNVVWIVAEDLSAILPPWGDSTLATPNISRLASEGVLYTHLFSPSGVCAPSRAAKIKLSCPTGGTQLAYQWVEKTGEATPNWTIYQAPVEPRKGIRCWCRRIVLGTGLVGWFGWGFRSLWVLRGLGRNVDVDIMGLVGIL